MFVVPTDEVTIHFATAYAVITGMHDVNMCT